MYEDVFAPNLCAICGTRVCGAKAGVPNYLCACCLREHREAVEGQAAWYVFLYRQESNRRKRRARRFMPGYAHPMAVSLDMMAGRGRL